MSWGPTWIIVYSISILIYCIGSWYRFLKRSNMSACDNNIHWCRTKTVCYKQKQELVHYRHTSMDTHLGERGRRFISMEFFFLHYPRSYLVMTSSWIYSDIFKPASGKLFTRVIRRVTLYLPLPSTSHIVSSVKIQSSSCSTRWLHKGETPSNGIYRTGEDKKAKYATPLESILPFPPVVAMTEKRTQHTEEWQSERDED